MHMISLPDYTVTITFENGSSVSYTVDAATLSVSIDEPAAAGGYSVMVAAINGAGEGQPGAPSIGRKLATIFSVICMYMYAPRPYTSYAIFRAEVRNWFCHCCRHCCPHRIYRALR